MGSEKSSRNPRTAKISRISFGPGRRPLRRPQDAR
jgi:hypothetical protein